MHTSEPSLLTWDAACKHQQFHHFWVSLSFEAACLTEQIPYFIGLMTEVLIEFTSIPGFVVDYASLLHSSISKLSSQGAFPAAQ